MKTEKLTGSVVSAVAMTGGAMASRVVAGSTKTVIKNAKVRHGVLAGVAILGAALLDRKTSVGAFTQDVAIGISATQLGYLAKEFFAPEKEGTLKTALGNPYGADTIEFLASPSYDFIPAPEQSYTDYEEYPMSIDFVG